MLKREGNKLRDYPIVGKLINLKRCLNTVSNYTSKSFLDNTIVLLQTFLRKEKK